MKKRTFLQYFLSYFIVLCILMIGFIMIAKEMLTNIYSKQLHTNVVQRFDLAQEQLESHIATISQMHYQLANSKSLIDYRTDPTNYNLSNLHSDMKKLDSSNDFIDSIVFVDKNSSVAVSTKYLVKYEDDTCFIYDNSVNCSPLNLKESESLGKNFLYFLPTPYLLFFPNNTRSDFMFFYMIDLANLTKFFKNHTIEGISAFALIHTGNSQIYGIHADQIADIMSVGNLPLETGFYPYDKDTSLYVRSDIYMDYGLVALVSNEAYASQINEAFYTTCRLFLLICAIGILLIFFSMKLTYFPLAKFVRQVIPQPQSSQDFITQLNKEFSQAQTAKEKLQEKINKYYLSIQTALLDSGMNDCMKSDFCQNIDQIFHTDCINCIYMIRIQFKDQNFPDEKIHEFLSSMLPKESSSITLEIQSDYRTYIVNYIGSELDKDAVIFSLMMDLHQELGCFCAISNSVSSLTAIPSLYENVLLASNAWAESPVTAYSDIGSLYNDKNSSVYPYKLLERLDDNLKKLDFSEAKALLEQLLAQIDQLSASDTNYPDFMIRCLSIDVLITMITYMNHHNVKFKLYNELYYETLYFCRNFDWQEKRKEITDNLISLLDLFESELHMIRATQIQEYLEEHYASYNLSVAIMADHFHVCAAYMSYLFKKELGGNFVDYLWNLRYEKAVDLLLYTDVSIETISRQVGYTSITSFGRKFKQKTGMSPSQYRLLHRPEAAPPQNDCN